MEVRMKCFYYNYDIPFKYLIKHIHYTYNIKIFSRSIQIKFSFSDVKLDGGVKTANNVIHIQVVFTETVQNHGSVTANQDGEACYVIKVSLL